MTLNSTAVPFLIRRLQHQQHEACSTGGQNAHRQWRNSIPQIIMPRICGARIYTTPSSCNHGRWFNHPTSNEKWTTLDNKTAKQNAGCQEGGSATKLWLKLFPATSSHAVPNWAILWVDHEAPLGMATSQLTVHTIDFKEHAITWSSEWGS